MSKEKLQLVYLGEVIAEQDIDSRWLKERSNGVSFDITFHLEPEEKEKDE